MASNAPEVVAPTEKEVQVSQDVVSLDSSEKNTQDEEKGVGQHVPVDAAAESRLLKKLDTNLIPLLFALCKSRQQYLKTFERMILTLPRPNELLGSI
jgi:hypothetical protein